MQKVQFITDWPDIYHTYKVIFEIFVALILVTKA
jgi:hypothetical protein